MFCLNITGLPELAEENSRLCSEAYNVVFIFPCLPREYLYILFCCVCSCVTDRVCMVTSKYVGLAGRFCFFSK